MNKSEKRGLGTATGVFLALIALVAVAVLVVVPLGPIRCSAVLTIGGTYNNNNSPSISGLYIAAFPGSCIASTLIGTPAISVTTATYSNLHDASGQVSLVQTSEPFTAYGKLIDIQYNPALGTTSLFATTLKISGIEQGTYTVTFSTPLPGGSASATLTLKES